MAREIIVYADESVRSGRYFGDFFGGAAVLSRDLEEVESTLLQAAREENLLAELKWQKISARYCPKYVAFVNELFDLIDARKLRLRVMFTENSLVPQGLTDYHRSNSYHILYRYFLKHAFGLEHAGASDVVTRVRFYLDSLPGTKERNAEFRGRIAALESYPPFRRAHLRFPSDQIAEVRSHDHIILQGLDVVMGAIQFRLNDGHKVTNAETGRRGAKTIAKEKVYKAVQKRIQATYERQFNIGITTSDRGDRRNRWLDPYRHWKFTPRDAIRDRDRTK
jgi:Protein of unknown function (DUF3800)